jgi:hypothetical protein
MDYYRRNTVWGFNGRAIENLEFLNAAPSGTVHKVTALVTSLQALIVFPFEKIEEKEENVDRLKRMTLVDLVDAGWFKWTFEEVAEPPHKTFFPKDLYQLVRCLRNAISHRGVYFTSEDRELDQVDIQFRDRHDKADNYDYWGTTINAADLYGFVIRFAKVLKTFEFDLE